MGPGLTAVERATQAFADPANRTQVREWHEQGVSFMDMVERLGIAPFFDDELRKAINGLKPNEIAVIREAMVAEIDRVGAKGTPEYPIDCTIGVVRGPVDVTPIRIDGRPVARVTPADG
jgi:hypothetical protein